MINIYNFTMANNVIGFNQFIKKSELNSKNKNLLQSLMENNKFTIVVYILVYKNDDIKNK
eukprot:jgi/Orpsp1_1/1183386/evm.model.c7180000084962.1